MSRNSKIQPAPSETPVSPYAPKDVVKTEFARRLRAAITAKGWTFAETAREATKHMPDKRHFGRDAISTYINFKNLPGPVHLSALAKALGKTPEGLLPSSGISFGPADKPPLDVRDLNDGHAWLIVNQRVSWDRLIKILELLKAPDATVGSSR